jgi:natural product precursor
MKLKKLVLNKEVVARITDNQMNRLRGGYGDSDNACTVYVKTECIACVTMDQTVCYHCPDTGINDCPNHSQAGSGCDAETCGWADTCNGR